jgi:dipeptidyl aminopeptidase/acylaminoacyl peptidase
VHVAASKGYFALIPNYRGSTGRGVEYSKLDQHAYADPEFSDIVDGKNHMVTLGWVDNDKVGITGGSYGGYATAWSSTALSEHYAAGAMFVGISDQISKVGTTDIPTEMYNVHARAWPWDDWQWFLERSPIFHVDKAKTPLLILHGEDDTRVHPSQSIEMYRHLKLRGQAPVRLILYPGEGHGNKKAAAQYDYSTRLLRWMDHYLVGEGGEPPESLIDWTDRLADDDE